MNVIVIYRKFHPKMKEYTFSSVSHVSFFKIDHILKEKASFTSYKKIEVIPYILSGHLVLKLYINAYRNYRKFTNSRKLNNSLLNEKMGQGRN